jgi:hypothetical protein
VLANEYAMQYSIATKKNAIHVLLKFLAVRYDGIIPKISCLSNEISKLGHKPCPTSCILLVNNNKCYGKNIVVPISPYCSKYLWSSSQFDETTIYPYKR